MTTIFNVANAANRGDEGAVAIAKALETNTTVTMVYLWGCFLGDKGAVAIAEALETNTTVTTVDLCLNKFGDAGAVAIAKMLETNATVTEVALHFNKIGGEGVAAIAKALETNTTLTKLSIGGRDSGHEGAVAIGKMLETNMTVTDVHFYGNLATDEAEVTAALDTNIRLRVVVPALLLGVAHLPYMRLMITNLEKNAPKKLENAVEMGVVETWRAHPSSTPDVASIIMSYVDPDWKFTLGKRKRNDDLDHSSKRKRN